MAFPSSRLLMALKGGWDLRKFNCIRVPGSRAWRRLPRCRRSAIFSLWATMNMISAASPERGISPSGSRSVHAWSAPRISGPAAALRSSRRRPPDTSRPLRADPMLSALLLLPLRVMDFIPDTRRLALAWALKLAGDTVEATSIDQYILPYEEILIQLRKHPAMIIYPVILAIADGIALTIIG